TMLLGWVFVSVTRIGLALVLLSMICGSLPAALDQAQAGDSTLRHPVPSDIATVVRKLFGLDVEPAADRKPYYWIGDFNGDTIADLLVIVRLKGSTPKLPKDIVILNFWNGSAQSK